MEDYWPIFGVLMMEGVFFLYQLARGPFSRGGWRDRPEERVLHASPCRLSWQAPVGRAFFDLASSSTHSFFSVQLEWAWQPKAASWQAACLVVLQQEASGSCSEWQPTVHWPGCLPLQPPHYPPSPLSAVLEWSPLLPPVGTSSMFHWCRTIATPLLSPRAISPGWGGGLPLARTFQPWSGSCWI